MVRPRDKRHKGLPEGLYPPADKGRSFRLRDPVSGRMQSLGTKSEAEARKLHAAIYPQLLEGKLAIQAEALKTRLLTVRRAKESGTAALMGNAPPLPHGLDAKVGTVAALALEMIPLIPSFTTHKNGEEKPLSKSVQASYRQNLTRIAKEDDFGRIPVRDFSDPDRGPQLVRTFLANWLEKKSMYNALKGVLSRLFDRAIDQGTIARNPCDPVKSKKTGVRKVYIPDDHYIAVTNTLSQEHHEVYAKCCDLMYLLSARNTDALTLEETEVHIFPEGPRVDENGEPVFGVIMFNATKNDADIDMDMNDDLYKLVEWFRAYKRREGVISKYLCVHPIRRTPTPAPLTVDDTKSMTVTAIAKILKISNNAWTKRVDKHGVAGALAMGVGKGHHACTSKLSGKPITNAHLRTRFNHAKKKAGFGAYDYTLRDLRPKGITDEAKLSGGEATNKGGWKPGSRMEQRYIKVRLPIRTANNLKVLR